MKASKIIKQKSPVKPMNDQLFIQTILDYLDEERERVNGILKAMLMTVYQSRGDFSEQSFRQIIAMIDGTLPEDKEKEL